MMNARRSSTVRRVFFPILGLNLLALFAILIGSIFVDYRELYHQTVLADTIEYQLLVSALIIAFEVAVVIWFLVRFSRRERPAVRDLLTAGEGEVIEFKSSLRWDHREGRVNKELEYVVAKTLAGFLNKNGGTLVIGVNDQGVVLGLEPDWNTLHKKDGDGFLLQLTNVVNTFLGTPVHRFLDITLERLNDKTVCLVTVSPSSFPVYLKRDERQEFFIRAASSTQPMEMAAAHTYITSHWRA